MKVNICGVKIDRHSFDQVIEEITRHLHSSDTPEYVVTPNVHHILLLQKDTHFRKIYQDAFLVVPDGVPLVWASKFLQTPLPGRVNGTDLFEQLCKVAAEKKLRVFLLGGRPGAADIAAEVLQARHPDLEIVGTYCPPYGFETDAAELALVNRKIKAAAPQILFVGLGAPKQECWIYDNFQEIGVPISVGIGVSFELVSGVVKRAPVWMQRAGLEWFFRLVVEPRRLWQRYVIGNPIFMGLVLRQRLGLLRVE